MSNNAFHVPTARATPLERNHDVVGMSGSSDQLDAMACPAASSGSNDPDTMDGEMEPDLAGLPHADLATRSKVRNTDTVSTETVHSIVVLIDRGYHDPARETEIRRLRRAATHQGIELRTIDFRDLELKFDGDRLEIRALREPIPADARVLVRLGARATQNQLAVLEILDDLGLHLEASPSAIRSTQHKLRTASMVSDLVVTPATLLSADVFDATVFGFYFGNTWKHPKVVKAPIGTNGDEVEPVFTAGELSGLRMRGHLTGHEGLLLQEYVGSRDEPSDVRVMFIGEPIGAMRRFPGVGQRVTNIARGGRGKVEVLTSELAELSTRICGRLGIEVAGLDFIVDEDGHPVLLEVNSAPGFLGFENVTGIDVASKMLKWLVR